MQFFFDNASLPQVTNSQPVPGCWAQQFKGHCQGWGTGPGGALVGQNCGDLAKDLSEFLGIPRGGVRQVGRGRLGYDPGAYCYMDSNCKYVKAALNTPICGIAGAFVSPISFLWDENASLSDGMTVVPFSIDARQPESYSLWKASEQAPLLVYDPKHTGKVTSATQLFGNYAFGGKTTKAAYHASGQARVSLGGRLPSAGAS